MPLWPLLLRVLLCLALVLNGTGAAMAGVAMERHLPQVAPGPQAEAASAQGCHDMASVSAATGAHQQAPDVPKPEPSKHPAPDCCKQSTCACACVQVAHALAPAVMASSVVPKAARLQPLAAVRHAAPALPHLIRPPIG